jgi:uncharacterized protein
LWAPAHPKVWLGAIPEVAPAEHVWAAYRNRASQPDAVIGYDSVMDRMDFFGNPVSIEFFRDLMTHEPFQTVTAHRGPALVVHGTADATVPISVGETYAQALETRGQTTFHAIPDAPHTFETLPTQREVHRVTLEFFEKTLLG